MSTARKILLVTGSMLITVLLTLGLARLPAAYPLRAALGISAEQWAHESFEVRLERELNEMLYPRNRPMLYHLAMLQVAEQERLARLETISRADRQNWGELIPGTLTGPVGFTPSTGAINIYRTRTDVSNQNSNQNLLLTLICFVFAIAWALARRA